MALPVGMTVQFLSHLHAYLLMLSVSIYMLLLLLNFSEVRFCVCWHFHDTCTGSWTRMLSLYAVVAMLTGSGQDQFISAAATAVIFTWVTFLKYLFALKDSKICLKDLIWLLNRKPIIVLLFKSSNKIEEKYLQSTTDTVRRTIVIFSNKIRQLTSLLNCPPLNKQRTTLAVGKAFWGWLTCRIFCNIKPIGLVGISCLKQK